MASIDITQPLDIANDKASRSRAHVLQSMKRGDVVFENLSKFADLSVLLLLGGIIISLVIGAWPAIKTYGFDFLTTHAGRLR